MIGLYIAILLFSSWELITYYIQNITDQSHLLQAHIIFTTFLPQCRSFAFLSECGQGS